MDTITEMKGEYAFLSNFHPSPITIEGQEYPTAEHAFQALKTDDPAERAAIAAAAKPGTAKRLGKKVNLRPGWNDGVRDAAMTQVIRAKFAPGTELAARLIATGTARIEEGNTWNDTYWGISLKTGKGKNRLGEILMAQREVLTLAQRGAELA